MKRTYIYRLKPIYRLSVTFYIVAQFTPYLSGLSLDTGWLVIFDRRSGLSPISDRTTTVNTISPNGRNIIVIRG